MLLCLLQTVLISLSLSLFLFFSSIISFIFSLSSSSAEGSYFCPFPYRPTKKGSLRLSKVNLKSIFRLCLGPFLNRPKYGHFFNPKSKIQFQSNRFSSLISAQVLHQFFLFFFFLVHNFLRILLLRVTSSCPVSSFGWCCPISTITARSQVFV